MTRFSKYRRSIGLFKEQGLDNLLYSAKIAAIKAANPATAQILQHLLSGGEVWAKETIESVDSVRGTSLCSEESSLAIKSKLGLSKTKYGELSRFTKKHLGMTV